MAGLFGDPALEAMLSETGALFHRLRHEAELIHGQGEFSSGRRSVLRGLAKQGPQTVPTMARARPVSRQYMQRVVNELTSDGLVEAVINPAHKRSSLIQITAGGRAQLDEMAARERKILQGIQIDLSPGDIDQATKTLQKVRRVFEGPEWQRRIAAATGSE